MLADPNSLPQAACCHLLQDQLCRDKGWWAGQELGFCQREGKGWEEQKGCEWGYL